MVISISFFLVAFKYKHMVTTQCKGKNKIRVGIMIHQAVQFIKVKSYLVPSAL